MEDIMFYYTYKITNLINEKIYIGVHKTKNLGDDYMGSGKVLNRAKDKHGIENFHKEILKFHDTQEEMFAHEAELVTRDFITRNDVYNIKLGGEGGWDFVNRVNGFESKQRASVLGNKALAEKFRADPKFKEQWRLKIRKGNKHTFANSPRLKAICAKNTDWTGRKHSEETKLKMSLVDRTGSKNSQFGKMWIYSLEDKKSTRINKNDSIPYGWIKGRKMF